MITTQRKYDIISGDDMTLATAVPDGDGLGLVEISLYDEEGTSAERQMLTRTEARELAAVLKECASDIDSSPDGLPKPKEQSHGDGADDMDDSC